MSYKKIIIAVVLSVLPMMGLSYVWHGILLNDFRHLSYSLALFMELEAVVYIVISLLMYFLIENLDIGEVKTFRGIKIGIVVGFLIYLVAFVFGVSFESTHALEHVVLDFSWQMFEQCIGGFVVGGVCQLSDRMARIADGAV